jgi:hypothetical protein
MQVADYGQEAGRMAERDYCAVLLEAPNLQLQDCVETSQTDHEAIGPVKPDQGPNTESLASVLLGQLSGILVLQELNE